MDFTVPADYWIKLKESEKKNKYHDLARELKWFWNLKVTIIPIVIEALDTVTKGFVKGLVDLKIRGRAETFETTALLRWARILSRVLAETCCLSDSRERLANADVKNSQGLKIMMIIIPSKRMDSLVPANRWRPRCRNKCISVQPWFCTCPNNRQLKPEKKRKRKQKKFSYTFGLFAGRRDRWLDSLTDK